MQRLKFFIFICAMSAGVIAFSNAKDPEPKTDKNPPDTTIAISKVRVVKSFPLRDLALVRVPIRNPHFFEMANSLSRRETVFQSGNGMAHVSGSSAGSTCTSVFGSGLWSCCSSWSSPVRSPAIRIQLEVRTKLVVPSGPLLVLALVLAPALMLTKVRVGAAGRLGRWRGCSSLLGLGWG